MKLKEPILRHLCKKYDISGRNEDKLVLRYLSQYSNIDVCQVSLKEMSDWGGTRRTFYVTRMNSGKKENTWVPVLEFRPNFSCYAPGMPNNTQPAHAELFDVDGDMAHVFIGSSGGRDYSRKAMWEQQKRAEVDRQAAVARAQKQEVAEPKVQQSNPNFLARFFNRCKAM